MINSEATDNYILHKTVQQFKLILLLRSNVLATFIVLVEISVRETK